MGFKNLFIQMSKIVYNNGKLEMTQVSSLKKWHIYFMEYYALVVIVKAIWQYSKLLTNQ